MCFVQVFMALSHAPFCKLTFSGSTCHEDNPDKPRAAIEGLLTRIDRYEQGEI
jgi:hypothetical protein